MRKGSGFRVQSSGVVERKSFRSTRRSGVTLLEVLWAILVASVGLLGAIAVFPVALSLARKGQVADMTSVGAHVAVHGFDAQYMRRPGRWIYFRDDSANNLHQTEFVIRTAPAPANTYDSSDPRAFIYPQNAPFTPPGNPAGYFFPQATPFGAAFCIDPRHFEQNRLAWPNDGTLWSYFPSVPDGTGFNSGAANANATSWGRILRITLHNGNPLAPTTALPMSAIQADQTFRVEDQLIFERPADNSLAAQQLFTQMNIGGTNVPGRRQEEGRVTWMATLSPKLDQPYFSAADVRSLFNKGASSSQDVNFFFTNSYNLSVVVFYDRTPDLIVPDISTTPANRPWNEWTAKILGGTQADPAGGFFGSGIGGGEVRIFTCDNNQYAPFNGNDFLGLKRGSWIVLSRTVPVGNRTGIGFGPNNQLTGVPDSPPYLFLQHLQWYRVSDSDETQFDSSSNRYYQDVSLVGPDFPIDLFNTNGVPGGDGIAEECDVFIVNGVSHVFERTIGLDREQIVQ